jgi:hypothetical protein
MSNADILLECARTVYEQEKGLGFTEDSTYITWQNPSAASLNDDIRINPLVLAQPEIDQQTVVRAHLQVGLAVAQMHVKHPIAHSPRYLEEFAERFKAAYELHDHELCIAAARSLVIAGQHAVFTLRRPVSRVIDAY